MLPSNLLSFCMVLQKQARAQFGGVSLTVCSCNMLAWLSRLCLSYSEPVSSRVGELALHEHPFALGGQIGVLKRSIWLSWARAILEDYDTAQLFYLVTKLKLGRRQHEEVH